VVPCVGGVCLAEMLYQIFVEITINHGSSNANIFYKTQVTIALRAELRCRFNTRINRMLCCS
jgi:hypothetical protein